MFKNNYSYSAKPRFKFIFKVLLSLIFIVAVIFFSADFLRFKHLYDLQSKQVVINTVNDILQLNSNLRSKISQLLIENKNLLVKLSNTPENTATIDEVKKLFKKKLPSFYNFSLADNQGNLITDIFFEQAGRMCRQDIKKFAVNKGKTWLTIHAGMGEYHYDLIVPWQYAETKRIIFISFYINDLVKILQKNERPKHELFIVRQDKNNLIELSSSGSRANQDNIFFLSDKRIKGISSHISGTYWSIFELPKLSIFNYYLQQVWYKKIAPLWSKYIFQEL